MQDTLGLDFAMPQTINEAPQALNMVLAKAGQRLAEQDGRGLIVFDGVDVLDDIDGLGALALSWMKRPMPSNFTLVFTYSDGKKRWLDFIRNKSLETLVELTVPIPSVGDGIEMVERYHKLRNMSLTEGQRKALQAWLQQSEEYPRDLQAFPERRRPMILALLREELLHRRMGVERIMGLTSNERDERMETLTK